MTALAALKPAVDDARFIDMLTEYRDAIIASGQRHFAFSTTDGVVDDRDRFEYELLQACRALPGGLPADLVIITIGILSPDPDDPVEVARKAAEAERAAGALVALSEYPRSTSPPARALEPAKAVSGPSDDPSAGCSAPLHRHPLSGGSGGGSESRCYGLAGPLAYTSAIDHLPALLAETGFGLHRDGPAFLLTTSDGTIIGRGDLAECTRLARKFGRAEA